MRNCAAAHVRWFVLCATAIVSSSALAADTSTPDPAPKASSEAYAHFSSALRLLRMQDTEGAFAELKQVVQIDAAAAQAWFYIGACYRAQGKLKDAADSYRKAIEICKDDFRYMFELGRVEFLLGNEEEGIKQWEAASELAEGPSAGFICERLSKYYERKGQTDKAMALLDKSMRASDRPAELGEDLLEMQQKAGKWEEAIETCRYLLKQQPQAQNLRIRIAEIYESHAKWAEALAEYDALLADAPEEIDSIAVLMKATDASRRAGHPEQAEEYLRKSIDLCTKAVADGSDDPRLFSRLGALLTRAGETQKAIEALTEGLKHAEGAETIAINAMLAFVYGFDCRPDDAESALLAAMALNPQNAELRARLGSLYTDMMRFQDAADSFEKAVELSEGAKQLLYRGMLADVYVELKTYDKAEQELNAILAADPKDGRFMAALGKVRKKAGQWDKAAEAFEKAITDGVPGLAHEAVWRVLLAECYGQLNQPDKAKQQFDAVAKLAGGPTTGPQLAYMLHEMQHNDQAIAIFESCIAMPEVNKPAVRAALCRTYAAAGKSDKAAEQLKMLTEENPENPEVLRMVAQLCIDQKNFNEATKAISKAMELEKDPDKALIGRMIEASLLHEMGKKKEAEEAYKAILGDHAEDATVNNNFSYFYAVENRNLEDAMKMAKKALQAEPENSAFLDTCGWVLFQEGNYKAALYKLYQAYQKEADPAVAEHVGDALMKLGRKQEAIEKWKTALEKDPRAPGVAQKIENANKQD